MAMVGLEVRTDLSSEELRSKARGEKDARVVRRALAIALVLDGYSRTNAALAVGMERQAVRDAVRRYNAEGWSGLYDRPRSGRPRKLTIEEEMRLKEIIEEGPPPESNQSEYRIRHLMEIVFMDFDVIFSHSGLRTVLDRLNLSWMTGRPIHPKTDIDAQEKFKAEFSAVAQIIAENNPDKKIEIWFQDEARAGQKGSLAYRWAEKGTRPRVIKDRRFESAWIFGAVCPKRDLGVGLVFSKANADSMNIFLQEVSKNVDVESHAIMLVDQAGWHIAKKLNIPSNITLVRLPPYSPELNPTENVWEFLRSNYLSHKIYQTIDDVIDACCRAWNSVIGEAGRIRSICTRSWATV